MRLNGGSVVINLGRWEGRPETLDASLGDGRVGERELAEPGEDGVGTWRPPRPIAGVTSEAAWCRTTGNT
jgi:hypothetical protein